jgi:hypothetical protein
MDGLAHPQLQTFSMPQKITGFEMQSAGFRGARVLDRGRRESGKGAGWSGFLAKKDKLFPTSSGDLPTQEKTAIRRHDLYV